MLNSRKSRRTPVIRGCWSSSRRPARRVGRRPLFDRLEDRALLSTWMVGNLGDDGDGSLRWAVAQANADSDPAGAIVRFDPTFFAMPQTITLGSPLELTNTMVPVTVDGSGAGPVTMTISDDFRTFEVRAGTTAALKGLAICGRPTGEYGGGIASNGTLTVEACTVSGCNGELGGIETHGSLLVENSTIVSNFGLAAGGIGIYGGSTRVSDSTISGNNSASTGGGIANRGGDSLIIDRSTIAENRGVLEGGGIYSPGGELTVLDSSVVYNSSPYGGGILASDISKSITITNSTIAHNSADNEGGGVFCRDDLYGTGGSMVLTNVTVAYNSAGQGHGGIQIAPGSEAKLNNTVVALNIGGPLREASDLSGSLDPSSAYNLVGTGGSGGLVDGVNGNLVGVVSPGLADLADNGGPTQTIALLPDSPAIDAGGDELAIDPATGQPLVSDQRGSGHDRIRDGTVDIGAFEEQNVRRLAVTAQPPASVTAGETFALIVAVVNEFGQVDVGYNGTVAIVGVNPDQPFFGGTHLVTAVNGVATFSDLTLGRGGSGYTLSVVAAGVRQAATTSSIEVTPAPATRFWLGWSGGLLAGVPFQLEAYARDAFDNPVPAFHDPVTVELSTNPTGATLGGTRTVDAVNGVARFTDLTIDRAGDGYDLCVSSDGRALTILRSFGVGTTVGPAVDVRWGTSGRATLETDGDGLRLLPAGRQVDVPWLGIQRLAISLEAPAELAATDVSVLGAEGIDYGPVTVSGSGTGYTIILARPIDIADRVTFSIGSPLIEAFTRRIDVLPGDVNDDGVVGAQDAVLIRNQIIGYLGTKPTVFGDITGDGIVDQSDFAMTRKKLGMRLT